MNIAARLAWSAGIGTLSVVALSVLAGCAAAIESPSSTAGATTASPTEASGTGPPGPTGVPSSGVAPRELTASPAPLPAGTYTVAAFVPTVTLDVDGTWSSVNRAPDFFDVQQDVGSPDVVAVQVVRPAGIVGADGTPASPTDPAAAIETLRSNPGLMEIEASESRIGGLTGRQVTVENTTGRIVEVLRVGAGTVSIADGRRLWTAWFATPDGLVGIMVGGSVATWDRALGLAEPVLESIRFGG